MSNSIIHAFDFDGVICDSAVETAITGWKAAGQIWPDMQADMPDALIDSFRRIRPIIETGYEAILAMRMLQQGDSIGDIYNGYTDRTTVLLQQAQVSTDELKQLFGDTRDQWIADNRDEWIAMNPLFSGVAEKLKTLEADSWYIVTTKQERFVRKILKANDISLADQRIFGLDRNMSKPEVLTGLLANHPSQTMRFLEDRLPALLGVQKHPALSSVNLFFARWGYNTREDKALVAARQDIIGLNLENFLS
ncbi:MAG: HAD family hydrolase [Methylomonas sp.]|jgi:phosphoglycolate phosphatase-like HAD superfamily hydrolase|uniref:HAD family hydrolase n=1 Tax=Methylomonas sp. TaxID=418 RepID=UPI0025F67249|nr:HAD family hydrolase [Methylomonas sp.]MCK9604983.1 HAD family hydrolase [Methylomonas sp.]